MEIDNAYDNIMKQIRDNLDRWKKEAEIAKMLAEFKRTRSITTAVAICNKLLEEDN